MYQITGCCLRAKNVMKMRVIVIPIVVGALGTVPESWKEGGRNSISEKESRPNKPQRLRSTGLLRRVLEI